MWVALLPAWIACKSEDAGPAEPVSFVTFNAGLAVGFVPGAASRLQPIADAIGALDADVVCLQEVWLDDQIAAVDAAASASFPHRFFPAPQQSSDAQCAPGDLDSVLDCLDASCGDACVDELPDCLLASCVAPFLFLPIDCMRCAGAHIGDDPATVEASCVDDPVEFAYGGSFGTGVLSRYPMSPVEEHVFTSTTNRRSVLHTTVEAPSGPIDVWCTHLTAVFDLIPYPRETELLSPAAWEAEQADQIDELLALVTAGAGPTVLLGDLNTGPVLPGITAEAPANWQTLAGSGLAAPYVEQAAPECTYCAENPLQLGSADDDASRVIDHVMLQGFSEPVAERILDEAIAADTCGTPIDPAALSDHYGVRVTATPTAAPPAE